VEVRDGGGERKQWISTLGGRRYTSLESVMAMGIVERTPADSSSSLAPSISGHRDGCEMIGRYCFFVCVRWR